jgi:hypothetical protein
MKTVPELLGFVDYRSKEIQQPFDGPLRWQIASRSSSISYLVDLGGYKEMGECQCPHFVKTVGPAIKRGENRSCYHIEMARRKFDRWAIHEYALRDKNKPTDKEV